MIKKTFNLNKQEEDMLNQLLLKTRQENPHIRITVSDIIRLSIKHFHERQSIH